MLCVKSVTKRSFNTKNDITVEYNICDGGVMGSKETNFVGKYHCKEGTSRLIVLCKVTLYNPYNKVTGCPCVCTEGSR